MTPPDQNAHASSYFDLFVIWVLTAFGQLTLEKWVLLATLIYTILRAAVLIRDDFFKRGRTKGK